MSILQSARDSSALEAYLRSTPRTDPIHFSMETNDVGTSPQKTMISVFNSPLPGSTIPFNVPRMGLWTDATIRVTFTISSGSTLSTDTWGLLGCLSHLTLQAHGDLDLFTVWPESIIDWIQSSHDGAYGLWTGSRHLGNGHNIGSLLPGTHTMLLPVPLSNLRRLRYFYTRWMQELQLNVGLTELDTWNDDPSRVTIDEVAVLWDFKELSEAVIEERAIYAIERPLQRMLQHDSFRESDVVLKTEHVMTSPINHHSVRIPLECPYNVFRTIIVVKSEIGTLSTIAVESVLRVRLLNGDMTLYDATGPKMLRDMVTPPYRHNSEGAAVFALQFSNEPHHMGDSRAGQSGFMALGRMAVPAIIVDLDSDYVFAGVTTISIVHLYYKVQAVDARTGGVLQSALK